MLKTSRLVIGWRVPAAIRAIVPSSILDYHFRHFAGYLGKWRTDYGEILQGMGIECGPKETINRLGGDPSRYQDLGQKKSFNTLTANVLCLCYCVRCGLAWSKSLFKVVNLSHNVHWVYTAGRPITACRISFGWCWWWCIELNGDVGRLDNSCLLLAGPVHGRSH